MEIRFPVPVWVWALKTMLSAAHINFVANQTSPLLTAGGNVLTEVAPLLVTLLLVHFQGFDVVP